MIPIFCRILSSNQQDGTFLAYWSQKAGELKEKENNEKKDSSEVPIGVLDLEAETVVLRSGRWQTAEILMQFFGSNI